MSLKILVVFLLYFVLFFIVNKRFIKEKKDKNIILLLSLLIFNFNLSIGYNQFLVGQQLHVYIPAISIALFICACFVVKPQEIFSRKENREYYFLIFVMLLFPLSNVLEIVDYANYFRVSFVYYAMILILFIYIGIKEIDISKILYSINYLALFNALLSFAQYLTGKQLLLGSINSSIIYTEGIVDIKRVVGLAGSNNSAGNFGALLFGVVLYNCLKSKDLLSWLTLFLTSIFSILTLTRIGYVAIAIEIIVAFFMYIPRNKLETKLKKWIFILGLGLLCITTFLLKNKIISVLFTDRGNTADERFRQYNTVFKYILHDHILFGIGNGQYRTYIYEQSDHKIVDIPIHSQYLNVLAENGIFLFTLFVLLNAYLIYTTFVYCKKQNLLKMLVVLLSISNFICSNFNPNQYYFLTNVVYYLLMFGIMFYSKKQKQLKKLDQIKTVDMN